MTSQDMTMIMGSALPDWVSPLATGYLALSLLSALVIATDIYAARRRHATVAAEAVWITSALYLGPVAIAVYHRRGRTAVSAAVDAVPAPAAAAPGHRTIAALLPGGSASAIAHLVAVPAVAALGWTIAGLAMWPMILVIAVLAIAMVGIHELVVTRTQADPARRVTVGGAFLAAAITVAAFDIGMVGWMLLLHYNDAMPAADDRAFWFLMQVGVLVGLVTGYPAVRWLLRSRLTALPS